MLWAPDPELILHSGTDHTITPGLFNVVESLSSKAMLEVIVFMLLLHLTEGAGIKSTKRILSQQALLKFPDCVRYSGRSNSVRISHYLGSFQWQGVNETGTEIAKR